VTIPLEGESLAWKLLIHASQYLLLRSYDFWLSRWRDEGDRKAYILLHNIILGLQREKGG